MKLSLRLLFVLCVLPVSAVHAKDKSEKLVAKLSGFNEVHFIAGNATTPPALRGAVSTAASGQFTATIDKSETQIAYTIVYKGLEADVTQSHIHFGQKHTVGGIVVWLCQTTGTPAPTAVAASTPFCPGLRDGTVSGTITAAQVLTVTGQGIDATQFAELLRAIRAGAAYANVHSTTFTPGEIRGQIKVSGKKDNNDEDEDED
jgi:hypothetical protein